MSKIDQLERLVELLKQGLLTESEFNDAKSALISSQDSDVSISEEEPVSTATTAPEPDPIPVPIPVPTSSSVTEVEGISDSSEKMFDNYGRLIKPEFDQYGRKNNNSDVLAKFAIGIGGIVILYVILLVAYQTPPSDSQPSNTRSTTPQPRSKSSGNKSSNSNTSYKAQCAFQEVRGGSLIDHKGCRVTSRVNANGHTVYDVYERDGYKRSVVLWQDSSAEVFASGNRFTGRWTDQGEQALVNINGGLFTFRF